MKFPALRSAASQPPRPIHPIAIVDKSVDWRAVLTMGFTHRTAPDLLGGIGHMSPCDCPVCQAANLAGARYCCACGSALAISCPLCRSPNPSGARHCSHCGSRLFGQQADTEPLDVIDSGDITLTLRPVGEPVAPLPSEGEPTAAGVFDIELPADPAQAMQVPSEASWVWSDGVDHAAAQRAKAKAEHRAAVRRARLAAAIQSGESLRSELLVLDGDSAARHQLTTLLSGFGFLVHEAEDAVQAGRLLTSRAIAAAFLDIELDGAQRGAAAELCHRVKQVPARLQGRSPALIIMSSRSSSVERVRAAVAGADAFLRKPLTRGPVITALEDCGVGLPLDARQA
jgi:CheY-like chemotaxis protein